MAVLVTMIGMGFGLHSEFHKHYNITNNMIIASKQGDIVPILGDDLEAVPEGNHRVVDFRQLLGDRNEIVPFNVYNGSCMDDEIIGRASDSFNNNISAKPFPIIDRKLLNRGSSITISFQLEGEMEVFLSRYKSCLRRRDHCVDKGNYVYRLNVTQSMTLSIPIHSSGYYYLLIRSNNGVHVQLDYDLYFRYYSQNKTLFTECRVSHSNPNCKISVNDGQCYFLSTVKGYDHLQFYEYHISAMAERVEGIQAVVKYLAPLVILGALEIVIFIVILVCFCILCKRRYYERIP